MEFLIISGFAIAFFIVVVAVDKIMSRQQESSEIQKPVEPKRARTKRGRFKGDDPSTPNINEAWVGGKAPKPKKKKKAKKKTSGSKSKKTS